MTKIKLNNDEFQITAFTRTTYFRDDGVSSFANFDAVNLDLDQISILAQNPVTALQIYHNNELIYDLQNISVHIDNVNDSLEDEVISTKVNLTFDI